MLDGDCGILPVVENGDLIGVVTDRDLYIALATRDRRASELTVAEVAPSPVRMCDAEDELQAGLQTLGISADRNQDHRSALKSVPIQIGRGPARHLRSECRSSAQEDRI